MKSWIIAGIVVLMLILPAVSADIIIPGTKTINYCFEISNMNEYATYTFLLAEMAGGWQDSPDMLKSAYTKIITPGECFSFYKMAEAKIFAVEGDVPALALSIEGVNLSQIDATKLHKSDLNLRLTSSVKESSPLKSVKEMLRISSIAGGKLNVAKEKVVYGYEDGTTEEKLIVNNVVPDMPRKDSSYTTYIIVAGIVLAIIILIIALRRKK